MIKKEKLAQNKNKKEQYFSKYGPRAERVSEPLYFPDIQENDHT
jgi:hypothetical protein